MPGPTAAWDCFIWKRPAGRSASAARARPASICRQALKLSPDYPENQLNLIEAQLKWGDKKAAAAGLKALDEIWPDARKKLTGDEWASSWADWEKRREAAQKRRPA